MIDRHTFAQQSAHARASVVHVRQRPEALPRPWGSVRGAGGFKDISGSGGRILSMVMDGMLAGDGDGDANDGC